MTGHAASPSLTLEHVLGGSMLPRPIMSCMVGMFKHVGQKGQKLKRTSMSNPPRVQLWFIPGERRTDTLYQAGHHSFQRFESNNLLFRYNF